MRTQARLPIRSRGAGCSSVCSPCACSSPPSASSGPLVVESSRRSCAGPGSETCLGPASDLPRTCENCRRCAVNVTAVFEGGGYGVAVTATPWCCRLAGRDAAVGSTGLRSRPADAVTRRTRTQKALELERIARAEASSPPTRSRSPPPSPGTAHRTRLRTTTRCRRRRVLPRRTGTDAQLLPGQGDHPGRGGTHAGRAPTGDLDSARRRAAGLAPRPGAGAGAGLAGPRDRTRAGRRGGGRGAPAGMELSVSRLRALTRKELIVVMPPRPSCDEAGGAGRRRHDARRRSAWPSSASSSPRPWQRRSRRRSTPTRGRRRTTATLGRSANSGWGARRSGAPPLGHLPSAGHRPRHRRGAPAHPHGPCGESWPSRARSDGQPIAAAQLPRTSWSSSTRCARWAAGPVGGTLDVAIVESSTGALRATVTRRELDAWCAAAASTTRLPTATARPRPTAGCQPVPPDTCPVPLRAHPRPHLPAPGVPQPGGMG